jgi:monofunctional biosynthetic peptidoglycan transglycosylase
MKFSLFKSFILGINVLLLIAILIWGYLSLSLPDVTVFKATNPRTTALIELRKDEAHSGGKKLQVNLKWISYSKIPVTFKRAVVVAEDASFWMHKGVDWFEVKESIAKNLKEREYARGASTITQQLAKNLFLSPQKSIFRKIAEVYFTLELERNLSKARILELYMNVIEFGTGIFGIGSAVNHYFAKHPSELTLSEMIRLVAVIPNPLRLNPQKPGKGLNWRTETILERLYFYQFITETEYLKAKQELKAFFNENRIN